MSPDRRAATPRRRGRLVVLLAILVLIVGGVGRLLQAPDAGAGDPDSAPHRPPDTAGRSPASDADAEQRDSVFGCLAAAAQARARSALPAALRWLDRLPAHPPAGEDIAAAIESERLAVSAALAAEIAALASDLAEGRALHAVARLRALSEPPHPEVAAALAAAWEAHGWPAPAAPMPSTWLVPAAPLPGQRNVYVRWGQGIRAGSVVGASADPHEAVSVRIEHAGGALFPSIARHDLAPEQPTPAEVGGQLQAAARAGDVLTAWAWTAVARARRVPLGAPAPSGR